VSGNVPAKAGLRRGAPLAEGFSPAYVIGLGDLRLRFVGSNGSLLLKEMREEGWGKNSMFSNWIFSFLRIILPIGFGLFLLVLFQLLRRERE
jgi:hypothetical protein